MHIATPQYLPQPHTLRTLSYLAKSLSHLISWLFRCKVKETKNKSGKQDVARAHAAKVWFVLSKRGSSQTQQLLMASALRLLEGSSDFSALQGLTWPPVVNHMAHGLILSTEAKATEFAHLWKKAQTSSNACSCFSRTTRGIHLGPQPQVPLKSFTHTNERSQDGITVHTCVSAFHTHHFLTQALLPTKYPSKKN